MAEVQLCNWTGFCRTPLTCNYKDECARPGVAIAWVDESNAALGLPSTREQWAMAEKAEANERLKAARDESNEDGVKQ
jgi:hypothetical protein